VQNLPSSRSFYDLSLHRGSMYMKLQVDIPNVKSSQSNLNAQALKGKGRNHTIT
jgi:hypothetical protein